MHGGDPSDQRDEVVAQLIHVHAVLPGEGRELFDIIAGPGDMFSGFQVPAFDQVGPQTS